MKTLALASSLAALLLAGAIAGFFYAYSCSVMWGLDASDPRAAISAMQGINATVRNAVFAPAFFGTPVVALLAAAFWLAGGRAKSAAWLSLAAACYGLGALLPTMLVNVPMNEALATVTIPADREAAAAIWRDYSTRWLAWNHARTVASLLALLCVGLGLWRAGRAA